MKNKHLLPTELPFDEMVQVYKRRLLHIFVAVIIAMLFAIVILAGTAVAQPATPPSSVGEPPALESVEAQSMRLAAQFGTSSKVLAQAQVTAKDLDAMGISYPDWANGEPVSMRLVALVGNYSVPLLSQDGSSKRMAGDLTLMVIDDATGLPTVTIVTSGAESESLMQRVQAAMK